MIKIIITTAFLFGTSMIYAQQKDAPRSSREQIISTENPHNPLVNGIPYDQYKVQVQAEEKQRAAKEAEAKNQMKEELNREAKISLPPNPTLNNSEKTRK